MQDVVFYDANPSERALLVEKFTKLGLRVISLERLEDAEMALRKSAHPALFIADLSRKPEFLPELQTFVSRYISDPAHCILTSVRPTALANFLPHDLSTCFFNHVVERPFKTPEFIALVESLYDRTAFGDDSLSLPNSSVEQIVVSSEFVPPNEDELSQVDEVVKSVSVTLPVSALEASVNALPPLPALSVPQTPVPPSTADLYSTKADVRMDELSMSENLKTEADVLAGIVPLSDASETFLTMTTTPTRYSESDMASSDDEVERTLLITSAIRTPAPKATPMSVKRTPHASGLLTWDVWMALLRRTLLTGERVTLEVGNLPRVTVIILEMGNIVWVERCGTDGPVSIDDYLKRLSVSHDVSLERIERLMNGSVGLSTLLTDVSSFNDLLPMLETELSHCLESAIATTSAPYRVYEGCSHLAEMIMAVRPAFSLPLAPILFRQARSIPLDMQTVRIRRLFARPFRVPLNAAIILTPQEEEILSALAHPTKLETLASHLSFDPSSILPRLIWFEFVDLVVK